MEHKELTEKPGQRNRYSPFKRVIAMILVICLTFTMTGCTTSDGQSLTLFGAILGIVQGIVLAGGALIIAGIAWVLEVATSWQNQWTGWCMCGVSAFLFKSWGKLIDPNATFGDWSDMQKSDVSFHDEHQEKPDWSNKDKESSEDSETDKLYADPGAGEIRITYNTNGGFYGPEEEIAKSNKQYKVSKTIPIRPGYHFMGWAYDYENSEGQTLTSKEVEVGEDGQTVVTDKTQEAQDQVKYYPGKKTSEKLTGDTTLKAIWKSHTDMIMDLRAKTVGQKVESKDSLHKFSIKRKGKTPYVTIQCEDCGMICSDSYLGESEFMLMYKSKPRTSLFTSDKKMNELYALYSAQHIGPLALRFNTMYYNADIKQLNLIVNNAISVAENVKDPLEKISSTATSFAEKANATDKRKDALVEAVSQVFSEKDLEWAEEFFGSIADGTEKAGMALDALKAGYTVHKMFNKDMGVLEQTEGMLEFLEYISSFAGVDDLVSPVTETLKEGLTLVGKMDKAITHKENVLAGALFANHTGESAYLDHFLGQKYPCQNYLNYLNYKYDQATRYGCGCKDDPSVCPFINDKFYDGATVYEILDRMATSPSPHPIHGQLEKELLMFYLAERSEHELYMVSGLTLEEYADLLK